MSLKDPADNSGSCLVFAGTGGQGVITMAQLLTNFFAERRNCVVSAQVHGMSQRGGSVQSSVMIDAGISPIIRAGDADIVLGLEPVETVRTLPLISEKTIVFMNTSPVISCVLSQEYIHKQGPGEYPENEILIGSLRAVTANVFPFDATTMAEESGTEKVLNMVLLGCLFGTEYVDCGPEDFLACTMNKIPAGFRESNTRAFRAGVEFGLSVQLH